MRLFILSVFLASAVTAAELPIPEFQRLTLANGLQLYIAEDTSQAAVMLSAVVMSGDSYDPAKEIGLARMTAEACGTGISRFEGADLAMQLQRLGAGLSSWTDRDASFFSVNVIEKHWHEVLPILSNVLFAPTFPQGEISRLKKQRIADLKLGFDSPSTLVANHFMHVLYGERPESERSVGRISRDDIKKFHQTHYLPNRAIIIAIGKFNASNAIAALRQEFETWPAKPEPPSSPIHRLASSPPRMRLIHKPALTQATVRWGQSGLSRVDPSRFALGIADYALGGSSFTSRLWLAVREEGGRAYTVSSWSQACRDNGEYCIQTTTRNEGLANTMDTIRSVTEEFVRRGMTAEEYEQSRSHALGSLPIQYETPYQVVGALASGLSVGLSVEELRSAPDHYASVTLEEANRVAAEQIHPDQMVWVVVGDKKQIGTDLKRFGKVETVYYREPLDAGNFITRTRLGLGAAWNSAAQGPRVSLLHRWVSLAGMYGLDRSNQTWDYNRAAQVTLALHRNNSEYSGKSLYLGATATLAKDISGISPHVGFRVFPSSLWNHISLSTELGYSFWHDEPADKDLPAFYWSVGIDYFL